MKKLGLMGKKPALELRDEIEERADASLDLGLTRLREQLRAGELDTVGYIDRKELYELIEDVVDKCDDVANAIQSITAKHV